MIVVTSDLLPYAVLVPFAAALAVVLLARAPFPWIAPALAVVAGAATFVIGATEAKLVLERGGFAFVDIQGWTGVHVEGMGPFGVADVVLQPSGVPTLVAVELAALLALGLLASLASERRVAGALAALLVGLGAVSLVVLARRVDVACAGWALASLAGFWLLVSLEPRRTHVEAAARLFLLHRAGDALLFFGTSVVASAVGLAALDDVILTAPAMEPWARLTSGAFAGFAPREVWMLLGLLVVASAATRLGFVPLLPVMRDVSDAPGAAVGFAHGVCFLGAGLLMLLRLTPVLWLAPEALQVLAWTAVVSAVVAALWALAARDALRIDINLLCGFAAVPALCIAAADLGTAVLAVTLLVLGAVPLCVTSGALIDKTARPDPFTLGGLEHRMPRTHTTRLLTTGALFGPVFSGAVIAAAVVRDALMAPWLGLELAAVFLAGIALLALGAFRPLHLVYTGKDARQPLEHDVRDPPWWRALPPLVVALPLVGLGLLQIPEGALAALPVEVTYHAPAASLVLPERAVLEPVRLHLLPPWGGSPFGPIPVAVAALAAQLAGWLMSTWLYRGGPSRLHRALLSGPRTQRALVVFAQVASRESQVARGVGESATRLSRRVATHLVPGVLDTALRRAPSLIAVVLGAVVRFVADGSAQRGILVALAAWVALLLWWGRG